MSRPNFRVWDKQVRKMVADEYWLLCGSDGDPYKWSLGKLSRTDNYIVMQPTGLTDKNGKEIFEGDVLRLQRDGRFGTFQIGHEVGPFGYEFSWTSVMGYACPTHIMDQDDEWNLSNGEVIGNIYENPELLDA